MSAPIFVQLGRIGDILNVLPLAERHFRLTGERPYFMTAREFLPVLEGVSYVEPVAHDTKNWMEFIPAMFQARKISPDVRMSQICGVGLHNPRLCSSFLRESWAAVGADVPWGSLPLTIDRRDPAREEAIAGAAGIKTGRKLVLVALGGISSPFPRAGYVMRVLEERLGPEFKVVRIDAIKAPRIFDLLGIFERAHCLVTTDTATLHLAHAVPGLPVVALVNDMPDPWHGSCYRANHVGRFCYDELPAREDDFLERIRAGFNRRRRIVHVWSDFRSDDDRDSENARRMGVARASWNQEAETFPGIWLRTEFPIERARTSREVGDPRPVPFIIDMIEHAAKFCQGPDDIIGWTNSDVSFAPGLTGRVLDKVERYGACHTHRWDLHGANLERPYLHDGSVRRLQWYPGGDAFFFTLDWWRRNGADYPDMLMGREHNDEVFRQLVKLRAGIKAEVEASIYHEKHASFWESPENFKTNPGNIHNRKLAAAFFARHETKPNDHVWWTGNVDRRTQ